MKFLHSLKSECCGTFCKSVSFINVLYHSALETKVFVQHNRTFVMTQIMILSTDKNRWFKHSHVMNGLSFGKSDLFKLYLLRGSSVVKM